MTKDQLFCQIRREWVRATPEEKVRQNVLNYLVQALSFPLSGFCIEQSLKEMPHLKLYPSSLPNRRADLVFYAKDIHPQFSFYPLVAIECKAVKLTPKVINQLVGYNYYLKAYHLVIANAEEIKMGSYDSHTQTYHFKERVLSYQHLMQTYRSI